jgi:hypothetical protein
MTARDHSQGLDLLRPIYRKTSTYGHFGRADKDFTWEEARPRQDITGRSKTIIRTRIMNSKNGTYKVADLKLASEGPN